MRNIPSAIAATLLFVLLPPLAAGGAMGLPVLLCVAGVLAVRPSLLAQVFETKAWPLWIGLAFLAWAIASSFWSIQPGHVQAQKLAVLAPLGLIFAAAAGAEPTNRLVRAASVAAFAVTVALLTVEALWDMPLNRAANPDIPPHEVVRNVNRAAAVVLAMTWAAAGALILEGRQNLARAVMAASALLALPFGLWANLVAFGVGLVAFGVAFGAPRIAVMSVAAGIAGWLIAAPFATPLLLANPRLVDALPMSWAHRVGIWDYVCARILEQPLLGRGLDSARADTALINVRGAEMSAVPLHPHSASLQIWYETGAVGAVLAALAILGCGWAAARAFRHNRPAAAAAAASFTSLGVIANVSFGVWQEWWNATILIAAAMVAALSTRRA